MRAHLRRASIDTLPVNYRSWRDEAILEARNGVPMSVHEGFRQGAVFLSENEWNPATSLVERDPVGTVFFVTVKLDPADTDYNSPGTAVIYGVTAKHNLVDFEPNRTLYLVANKADGSGYKSIPTRAIDWTLHPDTDVAVCEMSLDAQDDITGTSTPLPWLTPKNKVTPQYSVVRLGDEVFTIGLYAGFQGARSVQPIARFGHIALMPNESEKVKVVMRDSDEQLDYEDLPEIEAYLAELNGWEGQSGSPVFASFGRRIEQVEMVQWTTPTEQPEPRSQFGVNLYDLNFGARYIVFRPEPVCIGLVQGYYPYEMPELNTQDVRWRFNLGISIIVPSDKIIETLMTQQLLEERARKLKQGNSRRWRPIAS